MASTKSDIIEARRKKIRVLIEDARAVAGTCRATFMEETARLLDDLANITEEYLKERMA